MSTTTASKLLQFISIDPSQAAAPDHSSEVSICYATTNITYRQAPLLLLTAHCMHKGHHNNHSTPSHSGNKCVQVVQTLRKSMGGITCQGDAIRAMSDDNMVDYDTDNEVVLIDL